MLGSAAHNAVLPAREIRGDLSTMHVLLHHGAVVGASHCKGIDTGFISLSPWKIAFLGVVQGITELLPISSTAHLRAVPAFLGWPDPGSAFSAAMQLAALAAVVSYFWTDVSGTTVGAWRALRNRRWHEPEFRLTLVVIVATIPIVIAGASLSKVLNSCHSPLRPPMVIGISSLVMALLLALTERMASHRRTGDHITFRDGILIGLAQVGALIPGVSRSGATLTAALGLEFERAQAARVSFLLGVPAIAAAGLHEIYELAKYHLPMQGWYLLAIGLVVSSLASFVAIWGLMRFLERFSTWPFVYYRMALGVLLIAGSIYGWF